MSSEELFMTCKENSLTIINIPTEIINNCNNLSHFCSRKVTK